MDLSLVHVGKKNPPNLPRRLSIQFWYDDCLGSPPIQEAPLVGTKLRQHERNGWDPVRFRKRRETGSLVAFMFSYYEISWNLINKLMRRIDLKILMNHYSRKSNQESALCHWLVLGCSHDRGWHCWGHRLGIALLQDFGGFVANWRGLAQGSCTNWSSNTKWTVLWLSICGKKMVKLISGFILHLTSFLGRKILGVFGETLWSCTIFPKKCVVFLVVMVLGGRWFSLRLETVEPPELANWGLAQQPPCGACPWRVPNHGRMMTLVAVIE